MLSRESKLWAFFRTKGLFRRLFDLLVTLVYASIAAAVFTASLPIFARGVGQSVPDFAPRPNGSIFNRNT